MFRHSPDRLAHWWPISVFDWFSPVIAIQFKQLVAWICRKGQHRTFVLVNNEKLRRECCRSGRREVDIQSGQCDHRRSANTAIFVIKRRLQITNFINLFLAECIRPGFYTEEGYASFPQKGIPLTSSFMPSLYRVRMPLPGRASFALLSHPNILIPQPGLFPDEGCHQLIAVGAIHYHHFYASR